MTFTDPGDILFGEPVEPVEPSPEVKTSIMSKLSSTPQLPRDVPPVRTLQSSPRADGPAETRARARWFNRPIAALAAVAAAVGIIVGGGVIANTIVDGSFQQAQADQLAELNAAQDMQRAVVELDGGGTATLVWSLELTRSALIVDGLEALPGDKVYELWYMGEDGARAAGTFSVADPGGAWRVLDGDMHSGDVVGVTIEPRPGSDQPTTDPILAIRSA